MRSAVIATAVAAVGAILAVSASGAGATSGVALSVNVASGRHAISPYIYGINFAADAPGLKTAFKVPINRWGGNSTSRYNYVNHTYNTGSDYYFENIVAGAAETLDSFVAKDKAAGVASLVTLPMVGWVSKNSPSSHPFLCSFPATTYPVQDDFDQWDPNCGTGTQDKYATMLATDPTITSNPINSTWAGAQVAYLVKKFGAASKGGVGIYQLDNEPDDWDSTHRDVHPNPPTYSELVSLSSATARAAKKADPTAKVLGPGSSAYCGYINSSGHICNAGADHTKYGDFAPWYLRQLAAASKASGKRLLDYFDEHFYPQADGIALSGAGSAATQALRLRSTRSLWDPTYPDESWIHDVRPAPLQFIRTMKKWVAANYPGTKTAISEYNWGALDTMNGALAQAEVLGVFGREGLDLATLWGGPSAQQPGAYAFKMYLNYDGKGAHFGETSVKSASSKPGTLSVFAAQRTADKALTIMVINKSGQSVTSSLAIAGNAATKAQPYRYSGAHLKSIVKLNVVKIVKGHVTVAYPANSVTLLVVPKK